MSANAAIEFHDSLLQRCDVDGVDVVVVLTAYVHRSAGRPGIDPGSGWTQGARLRVAGGRALIAGPIDLVAGTVHCGDRTYDAILPAPLTCEGATRVQLVYASGERAEIAGRGFSVELVGEGVYVEDFPGRAV